MEESTSPSEIVSLSEIVGANINDSVQGPSLTGRHGKPLRLFTITGRPVTDADGVPLQNITGKLLIRFNKNNSNFEDLLGYTLRDFMGRLITDRNFDPEKACSPEIHVKPLVDEYNQPRTLFDLYGYPLTDRKGRVLTLSSGKLLLKFDSNVEPVSDKDGHKIIECSLYFQKTINSKLLSINSKHPLLIFDLLKRPLTNKNGEPLLDIMGVPLVITDSKNNPVSTIYGSNIYDSKGKTAIDLEFDPTKSVNVNGMILPPYLDESGIPVLVFDLTGFPLTDRNGIPLVKSDGKPLLKYNKNRSSLPGRYHFKDMDVIQISITHYNPYNLRSICNGSGKPARLYNFQGKPLTNWLGEPLRHADNNIMLKFGYDACIKSDFQGLPIYDEYGVSMQEDSFTPFDSYTLDSKIPREIDDLKNGIKLYDASGMPVTDHRGFFLTNASKRHMIKRNVKNVPISDFRGGPLFTECGLPLVKSFDEPLLGPKGRVCRLFDYKGFPLTCNRGMVLKLFNGQYVLKVDKLGRIIGDIKGRCIYDCSGYPMTLSIKFNPSRSPKKIADNLIRDFNIFKITNQLYNIKGYPLTDCNGELLSDSCGKSLIKMDVASGFLWDNFGQPVIANEGFIYYDIDRLRNNPLQCDIPNDAFSKENTVLGEKKKCLPETINFNSNMKYKAKGPRKPLFNGLYQLYDCNSFPILDRSGGILETSDGEPIIKLNAKGQIISDYRGCDVYDIDDLPVTNTTGYWRDKKGNPLRLFSESGMPLTDSKGKPLYDNLGNCLLVRDEIGRPLLDRNNHAVYDAAGVPSTDQRFRPTKKPRFDNSNLPILDLNEKPMRIYNIKGWPLSDENGFPLVNNKSATLLDFSKLGLENITDFSGNTVYDGQGIPLGCKQDTPMKTIEGNTFRLYSLKGCPLTDRYGVPLRFANGLCLIVFDMFGRPIQDSEGEALYDSQGNIMGSSKFRPEVAPPVSQKQILQSGEIPLKLFDQDERPLTDSYGFVLQKNDGESLIFINAGVPLCAADGGCIFDEYGNEFTFTPDKSTLEYK